MDTLKAGGVTVSDSDSTASRPQKPDISAELQRAKESLNAWKRLLAEGKVESLVVKLDTPPGLAAEARMLSAEEQDQLRGAKQDIKAYMQRILQTAPIK
ncbi:hypothetical protein [Duganella vulcania]|uniref:hypothetical protein n=1 Tax=Duganella vulcania TaxID=2692166 RepID=UPI0020C1C833|nr:hypothetical protein [Duganella vulcania]